MTDPSALGRLKASLAASAGNIVFGMEDGTVSIFGLVFGVAATTSDSRVVLIAGAAGAFAAAVSMMAGTYLEVETNRDSARTLGARIKAEIAQDPRGVIERMEGLLRTGGMTDEQTAAVGGLLRADPLLLQGMATAAAPTASEVTQGPLVQALWMLIADFFSAAIPIVPFALMPVAEARWVSGTVTMALLIALGVGRARVGNRPLLRTVIQTVAIGVGVDRAFGR